MSGWENTEKSHRVSVPSDAQMIAIAQEGKQDMSQEQMAGITLCAIGLALCAKPMLVWRITESWKAEKSSAPSYRYRRVLRVVGGAALGVGALLLTGILK